MARIRTIKPEFFRHEGLYEAEQKEKLPLRLAYIGLWTVADREGRFKWQPRALKLDCLPYDAVDFSKVLDALDAHKFIIKYEVDGEFFGFIPSWESHQVINIREAKSTLPEPSAETHVHACARTTSSTFVLNGVNIPKGLRETVYAKDGHKCTRCKAVDDLTVDHIFPQSLGGTHAITNLRTLCRACNSARPVSGQRLLDDLAKDGLTMQDMQRMCMHVHAQGEGKGKEGKGKGKEGEGRVGGFDIFWRAYPKKTGIDDARRAFAKRNVDGDLLNTMLAAIKAQSASSQWKKDDGQFIPNPSTWLNQGRWQDQVFTGRTAADNEGWKPPELRGASEKLITAEVLQ